jgi:hypothetical protein
MALLNLSTCTSSPTMILHKSIDQKMCEKMMANLDMLKCIRSAHMSKDGFLHISAFIAICITEIRNEVK